LGIYSEYLDQNQKQQLDLVGERKKQLKRIAAYRNRDILVYAADVNKARQGAPVAVDNSDLTPVIDQVSNLKGNAIDVILTTGGGSGEAAEDIVRFLYDRYESVAFIIPSMAKSAGTIMAMAGDEILMEPSSSLGPIDAQIQWEGKVFSAEAFLKGLQSIKDEANQSNSLNRAYIPILQRISPGEIQSAENALSFAKVLVTKWLKEHKFKNWSVHRTHSAGSPVTDHEKEERAKEIAGKLCDHSTWLSHGRSIKISDLQGIGLEIRDYSKEDELADAIRRYNILLQMTFEQTGI
jgi:3D (Asp-Asp-Asp) domain-containing protein